MALFRDIPTPTKDDSPAACIEWAARRDPIGHRVHLALGMVALFAIPLASTPATIASTILFGYALLRAPTLWRTWRDLPKSPVVIAMVLLFAWMACSIAWSADPDKGIRLLRGSRYLLLIPALLPLLAHRRLLLQALTAGILVQCTAQFGEYLIGSGSAGGGFSEHPGHTALWYSIPLGFLLFEPKSVAGGRWCRGILFLLVGLGLLLTVSRSALIGTLAGLVIAFVLDDAMKQRKISGAVVVKIACFLIGAAILVSVSPISQRMNNAWSALTTPYEQGEFNIEQTRPLWWRAGTHAWQEHPVIGSGLGSAQEIITSNEEVQSIVAQSPKNASAARDDFHSTFVTVLVETGLIGSFFLLLWMALLAQSLVRNKEFRSILITGYIAWLGYSALNTTLFSGRLVAFSSTLLALSLVRDMTGHVGFRGAFGLSAGKGRTGLDGTKKAHE